MERIEWQLNRIRFHLSLIGILLTLLVAGLLTSTLG